MSGALIIPLAPAPNMHNSTIYLSPARKAIRTHEGVEHNMPVQPQSVIVTGPVADTSLPLGVQKVYMHYTIAAE